MGKIVFVLGLVLLAISGLTLADDLYQDGVIYDYKDFAVFASYWMDSNCSQSDWCNGCDFDMSDSVDVNDLRSIAGDWLFITIDDLAMAARDAADAGIEHAVNSMIGWWDGLAVKDRDAITNFFIIPPDPVSGTYGNASFTYNILPIPSDVSDPFYDPYAVALVESVGTAANMTRTVGVKLWFRFDFKAIGVEKGIDIGIGGGLYTIPSDEDFTIQTNSTVSPPTEGIVLRNGLVIPGEVVIGPGGDPNVVVIEKKDVVIEDGVRTAYDYMQFPSIGPPGLPAGVMTQDSTDPNNVWIISSNGTFESMNVGLFEGDPATIKIVGNNGQEVDEEGNLVFDSYGNPVWKPLKVFINGNLILGVDAELIVTDESALDLYLGGSMEAKNGSTITYENADVYKATYGGITPIPAVYEAFISEAAQSMTIKGTNACDSIILKNSSDFFGLIYAPKAYTEIRNSGDFYGAVAGSGELKVYNSGDFYYVAGLFDFPDLEILSIGIKPGSWWEEFNYQSDYACSIFETTVRKSSHYYRNTSTGTDELYVHYYSDGNTTKATAEPVPDRYAHFYTQGNILKIAQGPYSASSMTPYGTADSSEDIAVNTTSATFLQSEISYIVQLILNFDEGHQISCTAMPHN